MSELLPYLQTQLGHAEESEISNAVLVPLPYLRKLIAALEDRERLRAVEKAAGALSAAYRKPGGSVIGALANLRRALALESRDG